MVTNPGTLGKLIKVNEASAWWQESSLASKKGKQRRERNDSEFLPGARLYIQQLGSWKTPI